jgi:hypothetical protein
MPSSDWILISTTLFLGVIAIFGDRIKQLFYQPRPTVTFHEIAPYCQKTSYRIPNSNLNLPVFFFRFIIENTGNAKLNNCEAIFEQLWICDASGKHNKLTSWTETTLVWAGGRRPIISLDPHRKGYCNLGHIASEYYQESFEKQKVIDISGKHDQGLRFFFESNEIPNSQPSCLLPGKYAIKVMVYAENINPIELWFEIVWTGKWQDSETEMFRELTINQIKSLE